MLQNGASDEEVQQFVASQTKTTETTETPEPITHPSVEDFTAAGDSFFRKEENLVPFLNESYATTPFTFRQAKVGKDAVEILKGDQEPGEGTVFNLNEGSVYDKIKMHIDRKNDANYDAYVNEQILEKTNLTLEDLLFTDRNINEADFYTKIDVETGAFEEFEFRGETYPVTKLRTTKKEGPALPLISTNPLSAILGAVAITGGIEDEYKDPDSSGVIELDDGRIIHYNDIWNQRDILAKVLENKAIKQEEVLKIEEFGTPEKIDEHIERNIDFYLGEEDRKILHLNDLIKSTDDETKISEYQAEIDKIKKDNGYEDLYDENGNFIKYKLDTDLLKQNEVDEQESQDLANGYDLENLKQKRREAYYRLLTLSKVAAKGIDQVEEEMGNFESLGDKFGQVFDSNRNSLNNDRRQLLKVLETNDIFNLGSRGYGHLPFVDDGSTNNALSSLPGGSNIARQYNDALKQFKVLSKAVDLKVDPKTKELEGFWKTTINNLSQSLTGQTVTGDKFDAGDYEDAWEGILEENGYLIPEEIDEGWNSRGNRTRNFTQGTANIITDMTPLLLEIAAFKKAGGMKSLQKSVGAVANRLTSKNSSKTYKFIVNKMVTPAVITANEWAIAEVAGQKLMGSDFGDEWKAQTVDLQTGETRLTMPIVMGMTGGTWGTFSNAMFGRMLRSPLGKTYAKLADMPKYGLGTITKAAGQGVTATSLLTISEAAQLTIDELVKDGKLPEAEQYAELTKTDHLLQMAIAMSVLSGQKLAPEFRKQVRKDVLRLNNNTPESKAAADYFKVNNKNNKDGRYEDGTGNYVDNLIQNKINEINKSDISKNEKAKKIEEALNFGRQLHRHNEVIETQKAMKESNDYDAYLQSRYIAAQALRTGDFKPGDRDVFGEMTKAELEMFFNDTGIKPGSAKEKYYQGVHDVLSYGNNMLNAAGITKGASARDVYLKNLMKQVTNELNIETLKEQIKKDPSKKHELERKIEKIKENNKEIGLEVKKSMEGFEKEFKKLMDIELAQARVIAKKLKTDFKVVGKNQYKKALERAGKEAEGLGSEAFIYKNTIYVNRSAAIEGRNLGVALHELTHRILKDSLKEDYFDPATGETRRRVSKDGKIVIDNMLKNLSGKEREIVQERIDEKYRYEDKERTIEKDPLDYYEEYITVLGDAIKNGRIQKTRSLRRNIGKLVYPMLKNKTGFEIDRTDMKKSGKDLFDMIQEIQSDGLTRRVQDFATKGTAETVFATSKSKSGFADKRIVEELGLTDATSKIVAENKRQFDLVVENAAKKGIKVSKEAVTQQIKDALVINNMPRVTALAKKAAAAGEATGLSGDLKKGFNDFFSEYSLKLVELANTWNPAINPNFGAYMNSLLPLKYSGILKELKGKSVEAISTSKEATAKKVSKVAGGVESSKEVLQKQTSKLKKFILDRTKKSQKGLDPQQLTNKIRKAAQNAITRSGDIRATMKNKPRLFLDNVEKSLENDLFKSIKDAFGTRDVYKDFINNSFEIVKEVSKTPRGLQKMISAKMDFAYKPIMNAKTGKQARMSVEEANNAGLPLDKTGQGPKMWEIDRKNFTEDNYKDWANAKGMSGSAFGTRKDGLARVLAIEIGKDAIPSTLKKPHQQAYDLSGKKLEGQTIDILAGLQSQQKNKIAAEALVAEVNNIVDRSPGMMFSISKSKLKAFEKLQEGLSIPERIKNLSKPENAEILKHYNQAGDIIEKLRQIEIEEFVNVELKKLREAEAEIVLSGTELQNRVDLVDIAVTNTSMSKVIDLFNKNNPSVKITSDPLAFAKEIDAKTNRPEKFIKFKKEIGEAINLLPAEVLNNSTILNLVLKSIGQGSLAVGTRINKKGQVKNQVWLKPSGNKAFLITEFPGKVINGKKGKSIPKIKDINGKERFIFEAANILNIGNFKSNKTKKGGLKEFFEKNGKKTNYQRLLTKWGRENIAKKGFTIEQTIEANKYIRELFVEANIKHLFNSKSSKQFAERADALHKLVQIQVNIGEGIMKGTNTVRYLTMEAPTKDVKRQDKSGYHAEHAFFNLAHNATISRLITKHRKSKDLNAFMKDYRKVSDNLFQYIITEKHRQSNEGRQPSGEMLGNTEFFEGGNVDPMLNVISKDPRKAFITLDLVTGKTVAETLSQTLKLGGKEAQRITRELGDVAYEIKNGKDFLKKDKAAENKLVETISFSKSKVKDLNFKEKTELAKKIDKAVFLGKSKKKKSRGMSTFDFDETVGISENFVIARKGKETRKISSAEWPFMGDIMLKEGWKMDFSDFNKVTKGKPGPLMQKLKNQIKKFGSENVFILTARAPESAKAIHDYLKSEGVNLPFKNITGLGNSTGEAKALWMLEKFSEGYNDMYFVDDALPNVKAVKDVLSQLDIKSKVQQAIMFSKSEKVNKIMEHSLGIDAKKVFSKAEAKFRGANKKRRKFFMTDSAADLELLIEPLYGKGEKGTQNQKWFRENYLKIWERGINDLNTAKQTIVNDYMNLRKKSKDVVKLLDKTVEGTSFTHDAAMRIYIWNKAGFKIPDLAKKTENKLVDYIKNNAELKQYADMVSKLTKIETGLKEPTADWWGETIAGEIGQIGKGVSRKQYLNEWMETSKEIFSESNLNKMESELGPKWRESMENMLYRMETGETRKRNLGRIGNAIMDYLNGSVGTIMNFNTRSAALQLISTVNFINHAENNPLAASRAFLNQKQYWKDWLKIMNSDMLKQRRQGLQINVSEVELAAAANIKQKGIGGASKRVLAKILKAGYIPTKIADSFAIATGGASYYRNRIRMYEKQGLSTKQAEAKAWLDFQAVAERTQQSSRPDLLSQQQISFEGRVLLPFANTPMQMNRIMMKAYLDIYKGRYKGWYGENSFTNKVSKIGYYGFVQSAIFAGLQSGLFALLANSDDEELIAKKKIQTMNTTADSFLRGMGVPGVVVSGIKNAGLAFVRENKKGFTADYSEVGEALLNMSPTIGSKFSGLDGAGNEYKFNKKEILRKGFVLDNYSAIDIGLQTIEVTTNYPVYRPKRKLENIQSMLDERNEIWQRTLNFWGWSDWDVGGVEYQQKQLELKRKKKKKSKTFTGI